MSALLEVTGLGVEFAVRSERLFGAAQRLRALDGIGFAIGPGEVLGVVGESGSGKSTIGRCVLGLQAPSAGRVLWQGRDLAGLDAAARQDFRRAVQVVFQDPLDALDPRFTIRQSIAEPLRSLHPDLPAAERRARVAVALDAVGLAAEHAGRFAHELSGGQCQRANIARALVLEPGLIVCDEPVSALDVSIGAQIINLLNRLRRERGLALLFVSHNLAVVRHLADRMLVLYLGRVMEAGPAEALCAEPRHPYTRLLLRSVPRAEPARAAFAARPAGEPPSALAPPSGCVFRTRCPHAEPACAEQVPAPEPAGDGHTVSCRRWREIDP